LHWQGANGVRHFTGEPPRARVAKRFALGAIGGGNCGDFKLRVIFEQLNEALAHHARRAEDSNTMFSHRSNVDRIYRIFQDLQDESCSSCKNRVNPV
jgi:hypothetical protein